jgi:hypothetical protein
VASLYSLDRRADTRRPDRVRAIPVWLEITVGDGVFNGVAPAGAERE